ncbi:MAG TPA: hypothetical protein VFP10_09160 [Candidatus Eisenbacteria bacterium]|nr:hypothetical protein [Candidatus Eisenbacteria bacterium]
MSRAVLTIFSGILMLVALAGAAMGAPIFNTAALTPSAISPNGDGIQDETVITFDVAVDAADVLVLLEEPGGAIVDTLLVSTLLPRGVHALTFDGVGPSGPVADGSYEVRLLGEGANNEGTESELLPLSIDRVPPIISVWTLSPGIPSIVQNGDVLTMQACVEGGFESISVDLSSVDSNFDPSLVDVDLLPDPCRLFHYTISTGNTRDDAAQLPVEVHTSDEAGNVSSATFAVCLSNHPPAVTRPAELLNEVAFFQNGDEIQTRVGFSSSNPLNVVADFSNIDSEFEADSVRVTAEGAGVYRVRYRLQAGNIRPDADYRVRLLAYDPGCGVAADSSVVVTLDNAGVNSSLVEDFFADPPAFSPSGNGAKTVGIHFTVLEDTLIVSISTLVALRNPTDTLLIPIQLSRTFVRGVHTVLWNGSFGSFVPPERLVDQNLTLVLRATSIALDRQRSVFTNLEVDNVAPILKAFPLPGTVQAKNGQVLNIPLTYDRSGYELTAELSAVDSNWNSSTANLVVADSSGGKYGIFYAVSLTNIFLDDPDLLVPVTAVDRAGNHATVTELVKVCLNNLPPRFISARLLGEQSPFRNGDRVLIETLWDSEPHQSALQGSADFSAVDDRYDPATRPAVVTRKPRKNGSPYDTLTVSYVIATTNTLFGTDLPVFVTARDSVTEGCGETEVVAAQIDLDSRAGTPPIFDTSSLIVESSPATLSGAAADADSVEILQDGAPVDTFAVNPLNRRFSGPVAVEPGENVFTARGFDRAGNVSPPSQPMTVFLVNRTLLTIPAAFTPGSEFFVALLEPADGVTVHIYTLEGIEIQRLESQAGGDIFRIPWDGKDHTGLLTSSGPCLAAVDVREGGSVRERLHKAFIFARRSSE